MIARRRYGGIKIPAGHCENQEVLRERDETPKLMPFPEQIAAVEERQAASRLEWQIEQWAEQQEREERQRALAEAEARREKERRSLQQRELAERLAREHRERAALQAAERTALQSQQTRDRLARLEAEEIQKQRHAAPWATFARLSNLLDPPAPEPASTTIYIEADQGSPHFGPDFSIEAVNRRWKFPWQP